MEIVYYLAALIVGAGGTFAALKFLGKGVAEVNPEARRDAEAKVAQLLDEGKRDADRIVKDAELRAKEEAFKRKEEITRDLEKMRTELRENERRLEKRENGIEDRARELGMKERTVDNELKKMTEKKAVLDRKTKDLEQLVAEETKRLSEITGLTRENAEKMLLERIEKELSDEIGRKIHNATETIKQTAEVKAREIITTAIQRYASDQCADTTVSTVDIPSEDMKGRIIGREGRNIRTFEKCAGVDVIVDDTPGVVIVSSFDTVRRETARIALSKLIQDGRIHPTRIEELVAETQAEMETHILETGRKAVMDLDLSMPSEPIQKLLGRLKYRTSYSQNVLNHSIEVSHLCGLMAAEIGLNINLAKRCGLLHDIGKAADHEMEGGHPKVGAELAKRYGESNPDVLHAIIGHHDDISIDHIYTVLVAAADAISAGRPGARRESLERYIKRLENLEAVACSFPEVEQAFAIQAGRELRVIASAVRTTDADAMRVCREIANAIEQQLDYPGEIKVTVIRETRTIEMAR
ncbi:ribonuclease Y [soil metagenome]